uniref:MAGE domain-containing protein n=1 Tax=Chlamydomonas euryale TaxID=1486919 RepID=A0A7R9YZZ2_9CHLO
MGTAPRGLTWVILTLLKLEGGKMDESVLWKWLGELGIAKDGEDGRHPQLGKVSDELHRMTEARLLVRTRKPPGVNGEVDNLLEWGDAACDGLPEKRFKPTLDKIFADHAAKLKSSVGEADAEVIELD